MREILFRAYIKTLKWIVPVERINFDCETVEVDLTDGNGDMSEYNFDEVVLMQYTGLTDKNGTKIFEGDIVKSTSELYANYGLTPTGKYRTDYYEIVCCAKNSYCFGTRKIGEGYISPKIYRDLTKKWYEVIGNIHDNPELLKGGAE